MGLVMFYAGFPGFIRWWVQPPLWWFHWGAWKTNLPLAGWSKMEPAERPLPRRPWLKHPNRLRRWGPRPNRWKGDIMATISGNLASGDLKFDKSFFGWNKIDWISIFSFCLAGRTFHFFLIFFVRSFPGIPSATRWLHVAPSAQAAERLSQMEMQRAAAAPSELVEWFPNTTTRNSKGGILLWGGWTIITTKICQFLTLSCYSLMNENHRTWQFWRLEPVISRPTICFRWNSGRLEVWWILNTSFFPLWS